MMLYRSMSRGGSLWMISVITIVIITGYNITHARFIF